MAKIYIVGESVFKYNSPHIAELIPATVSKLSVKDILNYLSSNYSKLNIREGSVYSYDCKHLCNFKIGFEGISISNANSKLKKE